MSLRACLIALLLGLPLGALAEGRKQVLVRLLGFSTPATAMIGMGTHVPLNQVLAPRMGLIATTMPDAQASQLEMPAHWQAMRIDPAGVAISPPLLLEGPIHVAVRDDDGHFGYRIITPVEQPIGILDLGSVSPLQGATLSITEEGEPLGIMVAVRPQTMTDSPEWLRALSVLAPRQAAMLIHGVSMPLPAGKALVVPGLSRGPIEVTATTIDGQRSVSRQVMLGTHDTTGLALGVADFFPASAGTTQVAGTLKRANGQGAAHSRLVFSAPPAQFETTTDAQGSFSISVPRDAFPAWILADAPLPGRLPPFDHQVHVFPLPAAPGPHLVLGLPLARPPVHTQGKQRLVTTSAHTTITLAGGGGICENQKNWPGELANMLNQIDTYGCAGVGKKVMRDEQFFQGSLMMSAWDYTSRFYRTVGVDDTPAQVCINSFQMQTDPVVAVVGQVTGPSVPLGNLLVLRVPLAPMVALDSPALKLNPRTDEFSTAFFTITNQPSYFPAILNGSFPEGVDLSSAQVWVSPLEGEADAVAFPAEVYKNHVVADLGCANLREVWVEVEGRDAHGNVYTDEKMIGFNPATGVGQGTFSPQ